MFETTTTTTTTTTTPTNTNTHIHIHTTPKMLKTAYLELIIGPMFSGKTSYLLDVYKKCKLCNIPIF